MFTLVYKSEATAHFDDTSIDKMLQASRLRNTKNDITGCLLYHKGKFVQLLEGEEHAVKALFKKIKNDKRHRNVTVLNMEESVLRIFGKWSMVYSKVQGDGETVKGGKRQLFDDIFHSSNAVCSPGNSKLALWVQVNKLLGKNRIQAA